MNKIPQSDLKLNMAGWPLDISLPQNQQQNVRLHTNDCLKVNVKEKKTGSGRKQNNTKLQDVKDLTHANFFVFCSRWTSRGSVSTASVFRWRTPTSTHASSPWGPSGTRPPSRSLWRTWTSRRCSSAPATSWRSKRTPPGTPSSAPSARPIPTTRTVSSGNKATSRHLKLQCIVLQGYLMTLAC